jgi:hypothetical protein
MRNTQHQLHELPSPARARPPGGAETFSVIRDAERAGAEFLLTDIDVAFTLLRSAAISRDEISSARDRQVARSAYQTVSAHLSTCASDFPHRQLIESRLQALGAELTRMGEVL